MVNLVFWVRYLHQILSNIYNCLSDDFYQGRSKFYSYYNLSKFKAHSLT